MSRRLIVLLALLGAVIAVPLAAAKTGTRTVTVNTRVDAAKVATDGAVTILAGRVSDPRLGAGATVYRVKGTTTQTARFKEWTDHGTLSGSATVQATPTSSGVAVAGSGKVTSGTGVYKHASGKLTITGTLGSDSIFRLHLTGKVTY